MDKGKINMGTSNTNEVSQSQSTVIPRYDIMCKNRTCQGQSMGPDSAITCIIVHLGKNIMKHFCPGLLYMFISWAITIKAPNNRKESAIFF
jgi:hypothetical protein